MFSFCMAMRAKESNTNILDGYQKTTSTDRNYIDDEITDFLELDKNYLQKFERQSNQQQQQKTYVCPVVVFLAENILNVQASKFIDVICLFMLEIYKHLRFETFHDGIK